MTAHKRDSSYALPSHIRWVQDIDRVIVVDDLTGRGYEFRGVGAVVWSWLPLAYSNAKLAQFLAPLLDAPMPEAAARLREMLEGWRAQGLLMISADGSNG